jgi:hypothetical protein
MIRFFLSDDKSHAFEEKCLQKDSDQDMMMREFNVEIFFFGETA